MNIRVDDMTLTVGEAAERVGSPQQDLKALNYKIEVYEQMERER